MQQGDLDTKNTEFWSELCGSTLARSLGITENTPDSLKRFDDAYMTVYPYLVPYVTKENLSDKKVLEIGLGYGTLGQLIATRGCHYYGLDIAAAPVAIMCSRLALLGLDVEGRVQVGSALAIPHEDAIFDYVYSIGCLHHTGNLAKAVSEVYRVLVPGGKAIIMLYNRHSFRQLVHVRVKRLCNLVSGRWQAKNYRNFAEHVRALYDTNVEGEAAPHTDYVTQREARRLFRQFPQVRIDVQNFDTYVFNKGKIVIPREKVLNNLGRILGLDLYIIARK